MAPILLATKGGAREEEKSIFHFYSVANFLAPFMNEGHPVAAAIFGVHFFLVTRHTVLGCHLSFPLVNTSL